MIEITEVTNAPKQKLVLVGENNEQIPLTLEFFPTQECWIYSFSYESLTVNSRRLSADSNILHQFKDIIPFGIACVVEDKVDPYDINDFSTERVKLYLLTEAEVTQVEGIVGG